MSLSLISEPAPKPRTITKNEAIDIWIARWLNIRRTDLLRRYGCDPRRLYEIWEGKRFPASRDQALKVFEERYPGLMDRVDFGVHQRIPSRSASPDQLALFEDTEA